MYMELPTLLFSKTRTIIVFPSYNLSINRIILYVICIMKHSFAKLSFLTLPIIALASCQDYEPFSEVEVSQTLFNRSYTEAFEEAFGKIDPEQNWGFEPMPIGGVDYDGTRAVNTNSNEWETVFHYVVPGPRGGEATENGHPWGWAAGDVTNYERAYVYWWFSTHQWPKSLVVNWNNFFIENVWGQPEHSRTNLENSGSFAGQHLGMDQLEILKVNGTKSAPSPSDPGSYINSYDLAKSYKFRDEHPNYEHINDFNSSGGAKEQVMYVYDVSTMDFAYLASEQDDDKYHNNWTIQRINGNYYLAFDYWHAKTSEASHYVEADGYYNDWILKLSNGEHQDDYYTRRIMCEDLGNTFDWDWNDVVFDVTTFTLNSKYYAMITLQAAGGTMPIYVGDTHHEAHALFGVSTSTPVNVAAPGKVQRPAVVYTIELTDDQLIERDGKKYCLAEKIPVYVGSKLDPSKLVTLDAEKGKAPQKFACASNTYWMNELTHIDKGHNFTKWVEQRTETNQMEWVQMEDIYMRHYSESNPLTAAEKDVLYEDLGKPTAVSYYPVDGNSYSSSASDTFVPWRDLWNTMVSNHGLEDTEFTAPRIWAKKDNGQDVGRSFISQAPNIYETEGQNDDPIAFSTNIWNKIEGKSFSDDKGNVGPFVQVWPEAPVTYVVTLSASEGGTVSGAGTYAQNQSVTITATPNFGYEFEQWSDGNTNNPRTISVTGDLNLSASFTSPYTVTVANVNKTDNSDVFATLSANGYDLLTTFSSSLTSGDNCIIQISVSNAGNVNIQYASNGVPATNYQTTAQAYINPGQPGNLMIPLVYDMLKITQGGSNVSSILIKKKP